MFRVHSAHECLQDDTYVVTIVVLILVSVRDRKENQGPASLRTFIFQRGPIIQVIILSKPSVVLKRRITAKY